MRTLKLLSIGLASGLVLSLTPVTVSAVDESAHRAELIQTITTNLHSDAAKESFAKNGVDAEKLIGKLGALNDAQLESLAAQSSSAMSQVGGELSNAGENDWIKMYGMYVLVTVIAVLLLAGA